MTQVPTRVALALGVTLALAEAGPRAMPLFDGTQPMTQTVIVTVGAASFRATLLDTPAATAFGRLLPLWLAMHELNGNEKFARLPTSLPVAAATPPGIRSGDLMLYGSNTLVLFYKTFRTTYSYTAIGSVDDPVGLEAALGAGNVMVTIEAAR